MSRDKKIELLIQDGCTKTEAEKHLRMAASYLRTLKNILMTIWQNGLFQKKNV